MDTLRRNYSTNSHPVITGFFDPDDIRPLPRIRIGLLLPDTGSQFGYVNFRIDTGADESILHPADSIRMGFQLNQLVVAQPSWASPGELVGVGGRVASYRVRAIYLLEHESRAQSVDGLVHIAQWTLDGSGLPSLLGWDVLRHFRLMMHWSTRLITLHEHDSKLFA